MRPFLTIFLFLSITASANFETVIKDQKFRDNFNLGPEENFVGISVELVNLKMVLDSGKRRNFM